jgi:hypothetical protein
MNEISNLAPIYRKMKVPGHSLANITTAVASFPPFLQASSRSDPELSAESIQ